MMGTTPAPGEILCPDPSKHDRSEIISDQASRAALLAAAASAEPKPAPSENLLTDDGKLSSRSKCSSHIRNM